MFSANSTIHTIFEFQATWFARKHFHACMCYICMVQNVVNHMQSMAMQLYEYWCVIYVKYLCLQEEPVVPEAVAPKAVGPKIKYAPAHHSPQLPKAVKTEPEDPVVPETPNALLQVADSNFQDKKNTESHEQSAPTHTATTESSGSNQTEGVTTGAELSTLVVDSNPQTVLTAWQEQNSSTKPTEENSPSEEEPQLFVTEITEGIDHQPTDHVCSTQAKETSILKDGETMVLPVKNLEQVSVNAKEDLELKQSNQSQSENVDGSFNNSPKQKESTTPNINSHTQPLKPPKDLKVEQQNELKNLPSIEDKKKALKERLRGEVEKEETKKRVPPPVPKRTSTVTDLFKAHLVETKEEEPNPESSVVKSSMKVSPLPAPKKLSIPLNFQQNSEEDSDKIQQKATSPTEAPKRLVIPQSLQLQPPPPPLSTHPGLAKKEEDRQQQLLQVETERSQPQKSKKRQSFFRKKGKDSDKEKSGVKRKPSFKADEPITLDDAEKQKQQRQEQEEAPVNPSPPHRTKKVIGVPTLGITPVQLDASGGGGELESIFKTITKHEWHPEDSEMKEDICSSTFGQSSVKVVKPPKVNKPEKYEEQQKLEKEDTPKQKPGHMKDNIGDISGVSTFNPKVFSTPPEIQETNFTFTTPISTDIFLNTSFLKESGNSQGTSTSSSPRTPSSSRHDTNNSSPSSIGVTNTSSQSPSVNTSISLPSTPKTPNSRSSQSTTSHNTPDYEHTAIPSTSIPQKLRSQENDSPPKTLSNSRTSGSLPLGFVVTSTGNPTQSVNPFGRQHRSLVDVVPGIPSVSRTLPRGTSLDQIHEDVDSPPVGIHLSRSHTISSKQREVKKSSTGAGPMNSKRLGNKKRGSVFKKNK